METKKETILIIGPEGVGKSQILNNLTTKTGFRENSKTVNIDLKSKTISKNGSSTRIQVWDTPGAEEFRNSLEGYVGRAKPNIVLVVIDPQTLSSVEGPAVLAQFLTGARANAPGAKIKIVVNKVERPEIPSVIKLSENNDPITFESEEAAIKRIKKECKQIIYDATKTVLTDVQLNLEKDIIYYSAKQEAEANEELESDPIIQHIIFNNIPVDDIQINELPLIDWDAIQERLVPKLVILGKGFLFLLMAAALTTVFIAIGAFIGGLAGAWSGPGAFFTAIGGAFAGAITAWNLSILIIAPVLGFSITGLGFGLWHRNPPPPPSVLSELDPKPDNASGFQPHTTYGSTGKAPHPALTENQSRSVIPRIEIPVKFDKSSTDDNSSDDTSPRKDNLSPKQTND